MGILLDDFVIAFSWVYSFPKGQAVVDKGGKVAYFWRQGNVKIQSCVIHQRLYPDVIEPDPVIGFFNM